MPVTEPDYRGQTQERSTRRPVALQTMKIYARLRAARAACPSARFVRAGLDESLASEPVQI